VFDDDDLDALEAGAAYALMRHGQDRQAELLRGLRGGEPEVHVDVQVYEEEPDEVARPVNALDLSTLDLPEDLDDFIGQEPLKAKLAVYMKSAQTRKVALPHILLTSGYPGAGKATMARLIAKTMGVDIYELVAPVNTPTLVQTAMRLRDQDILFIDDVHELAYNGNQGAEILQKFLKEKAVVLPAKGEVPLADITVIGSTVERDKTPQPVLDRFTIKPHFQHYTWEELSKIAVDLAYRFHIDYLIDDELAVDIAAACRGTPGVIEEMVIAVRDLTISFGEAPTSAELLEFLEVEPDGLTRSHIHYLTSMRQYFASESPGDWEIDCLADEATTRQILRETKVGLHRIENFLFDRGYLKVTARERRLTETGIARAEEFIAAGKGPPDIA